MTGQPKESWDAPAISVVLPVFNADKYVAKAIRSILDQTFRNFELIVINDGSTDGTLKVLEQFSALDRRVVLVSRENKGLVDTLNEGISIARGEWIARMDADDIAWPNRFERQMHWLEKSGADICGSWMQLFGTADKRIIKHPESDAAIKMELLFGAPFAHPTVIMRSELVEQLRYDKVWEKCEDYDLWERAARADWKMTNVPEVLLSYRQHGAQISTTVSSYQQLLTQKIRHRYWTFVFDSMKLEKGWIDEVLKLREPSLPETNMDIVDSAFMALLQCSRGEARATVFDHATRLYFRAAAVSPDVVTRWSKLNGNCGAGLAVATKIKLWLLSVLRIPSNSKSFQRLKQLYFNLTRST